MAAPRTPNPTPARKPAASATVVSTPAPISAAAPTPADSATAPSFAIAPAAAWVAKYTPEASADVQSDGEGISYLLIDEQQNLEPRAAYRHEAYRITSDNGVQNGSSVGVTFDPTYERLTFHFVRIVRNGQTLDRLDRSKFQLLQREREMESFLYDGSFTAACQLEDVRVGDVIEYAYTIEGANPVLKGHYFNTFATDWTVPVERAIVRIVRPVGRDLHFQMENRELQPKISAANGRTEWLWSENHIPAHHADASPPLGYNSFGLLRISEFANWQEVVAWAAPLYQVDGPASPELEQEITHIAAVKGAGDTVLAALRFVQEEIRYLGIEGGVGSHQPTAPSEVLRRRFGDCKDKTLLLATILRRAGFHATPVLVSSYSRAEVAKHLPSPGGFNHVVLQVEFGRSRCWLDATRSPQRGPISEVYITDFGYGLVLEPGTTELTPCGPPADALPKKKVTETYHIPRPGEETHLNVVTEYHGLAAEAARSTFQTVAKDTIEKDYLKYYARRFSGLRAAEPPVLEEIPGANACRVRESYVIPAIWELSDDKRSYELSLFPSDIDTEMGTPGATERRDPLGLRFPTDVTQEINAEMFNNWPLKTEDRHVENAFFAFDHFSKVIGRRVQMVYAYKTLADRVPVAELAKYDDALRRIKDKLGYTFTYRTPQQLAAAKGGTAGATPAATAAAAAAAARDDGFNWTAALALGAVLGSVIPPFVGVYRRSRLPIPLPPSHRHGSLDGLSGWLILVMLGLIARPFIHGALVVRLWPTIFHLGTWDRLTLPGGAAYHPMWMPSLLFELILNSVQVILSVFVLILFFQKRVIWPRWFVQPCVYCGARHAHRGYDSGRANSGRRQETASPRVKKVFFRPPCASAIWIPYALVSRRVRATFRY